MVLSPAHALHALTVGGAVHVDVVGDVRRADEGDCAHFGRLQQAVDRFLVAVDDVEHTRRAARFHEQLGEPDWHGGVFFRRLEDEGVTHGDGQREHPHRDHGREVERGDPRRHAQRLAHGVDVDARAGGVGVFALGHLRDTAGELDHLEPALNVAVGVCNDLAVLGGQQFGQLICVGLDQLLELEHHPRATLRVHGSPLGLGGGGGVDCLLQHACVGQIDLRLNFAGVRVVDVTLALAGTRHVGAVDEMLDLTHDRLSLRSVLAGWLVWPVGCLRTGLCRSSALDGSPETQLCPAAPKSKPENGSERGPESQLERGPESKLERRSESGPAGGRVGVLVGGRVGGRGAA